MNSSYVDYVHRGDRLRRRARIQRFLIVAGFVGAIGVVTSERHRSHDATASTFAFSLTGTERRLRSELDAAKGELALANAQLQRANHLIAYSARYDISAELAGSVYDIALAEGIEPELAFRLVKVESDFKERATSPVGAVGLGQVMFATAKYFEQGLTREKLYDRDTNLRIAFRYLRTLIKEQKGDVKMALLVYNRGPVAVQAAQAMGIDPRNGYERAVTRGYKGRGVVE